MKAIKRAVVISLMIMLFFSTALVPSYAASGPDIKIDGESVVNGSVYNKAVRPTWDESVWYSYTASLTSSQGTLSFSNGSAISAEGSYTLTVSRSSWLLGSGSTTVSFSLGLPPAAPSISGVSDGGAYSSSVTPIWSDAAGTTSTATLDGSPYKKGTAINTIGGHTLTVTARRASNGLTASTTVGFNIDLSNGDWTSKYVVIKNTPEADLMVRVGDVDNFGYGWTSTSTTFDPFSGNSTKIHSFPWTQPADEPDGMDKIMVVSGYSYKSSVPTDGYTGQTKGKDNTLETIKLDYRNDLSGITVNNASLQLFVDDFQPAGAKGIGNGKGTVQYQVTINGKRVSELEDMINNLDQSGPIGKLITLVIPSQYLADVQSGILELRFDDPVTKGADGYAIDFAKLLINLKSSDYRGNIAGTVTDSKTGKAIEGATITLPGRTESAVTASNGTYTISELTAGQLAVTANKDGYETKTQNNIDIIANTTTTVNFALKPNDTDAPTISLTKDISGPTTHHVHVTAEVHDDSGVSVIKYAKGTQTSAYFEKGNGINIKSDPTFTVDYEGKGYYTVYACDYSGNSSVKTIDVSNINKLGGSSILVTPKAGDTNAKFHLTLKQAEGAGQFELEYKLDGGSWYRYTAPFVIESGETVYTREADYSVEDDPRYEDGESRTVDFILKSEEMNSLNVSNSATVTITVNSAYVDPADPFRYITFENVTDAIQIIPQSVTPGGGDTYLLEYKITAKKAGFNNVVKIKVNNISTIVAPLKIQTLSTKGIM